jgi:hypothetical protein
MFSASAVQSHPSSNPPEPSGSTGSATAEGGVGANATVESSNVPHTVLRVANNASPPKTIDELVGMLRSRSKTTISPDQKRVLAEWVDNEVDRKVLSTITVDADERVGPHGVPETLLSLQIDLRDAHGSVRTPLDKWTRSSAKDGRKDETHDFFSALNRYIGLGKDTSLAQCRIGQTFTSLTLGPNPAFDVYFKRFAPPELEKLVETIFCCGKTTHPTQVTVTRGMASRTPDVIAAQEAPREASPEMITFREGLAHEFIKKVLDRAEGRAAFKECGEHIQALRAKYLPS